MGGVAKRRLACFAFPVVERALKEKRSDDVTKLNF